MANFLGGLKDKIGGVFSGGKVDQRFLPNNELIETYNMSSGSLFKVNIQAFKTPDQKIKKSSDGLTVESITNPTPMGEFQILYSEDSLSIDHQHNFGAPDNIITDITKKLGLGAEKQGYLNNRNVQIAKAAKEMFYDEGAGGVNQTTFNTDWNTFGSMDFAKAYQGSTPPSFRLKFALIATKDPLMEVVIPAVIMTYLSYPKLNKDKEITDLLGILDKSSNSLLGGIDGGLGSLTGTNNTDESAQKIEKKAIAKLSDAKKLLKSSSSSKWRYIIGDAPPFWTLSTSNGLFGMNNASLTNVNVEYFGPWVEAPAEQNIIDQLAGASQAGFNPSAIFPGTNPMENVSSLIAGGFLGKESTKGGYPSHAVVTLNFQNNFSQIFGEEWLMNLVGGGSTVSTSVIG